MMLSLIACALVCAAEEITQTDSLHSTSITVSPEMLFGDLRISINSSIPENSLLLMASLSPIQFEISGNEWNIDSQFYDLEGWATSSNLSIKIDGEYLSPGATIYISIYKSYDRSLTYTIDYESVPRNDCECSMNAQCLDGVCDCAMHYKGTRCQLKLQDFVMEHPSVFHLGAHKWQFFTMYLPEDYETVTFEGSLIVGSPYIFLDQYPDSKSSPASMFYHSSYLHFDEDTQISSTLDKTNSKYWLIGVYCSGRLCDFTLKATSSLVTDHEVLWIVIIIVISIAVFCLSLPFIFKLLIRCRASATVVQEISNFLLPEQMEKHYPTKKWERVKKDNIESCSICLEDFKNDSKVRVLYCAHVFHSACIDSWASNRANCPLCKEDIDPRTPSLQGLAANIQVQDVE